MDDAAWFNCKQLTLGDGFILLTTTATKCRHSDLNPVRVESCCTGEQVPYKGMQMMKVALAQDEGLNSFVLIQKKKLQCPTNDRIEQG